MTSKGRVHSFKLDRSGLGRVFGELEASIMEAIWSVGPATVAEVRESLGDGHHHKTVMTVMNRLVAKGILERERRQRAYEYRAVDSRDDFLARVSRRVVEGLVHDFGDVAVAQLLDTLDTIDPVLLARLEALVAARRHDGPATPSASGDGASSSEDGV